MVFVVPSCAPFFFPPVMNPIAHDHQNDDEAWGRVRDMFFLNERMARWYGRKMCEEWCGRWAVYEADGETTRWYCPICYCTTSARDVDQWWNWRKISLSRRHGSPAQHVLALPDVTDLIRSFLLIRPGRYDMCCCCEDGDPPPRCETAWFDQGWVCQDHLARTRVTALVNTMNEALLFLAAWFFSPRYSFALGCTLVVLSNRQWSKFHFMR